MTTWKPIETAPTDGSSFLVSTNGDGIRIAHWDSAWACFMDDYGAPFGRHEGLTTAPWIEASFWMPLPDPPYYDD